MKHYILTPDRISNRNRCIDRYEPLVKFPGNPVFVAEKPWEGDHVAWPTILYFPEEKLYKMWYQTMTRESEGSEDQLEIDNVEVAQTRQYLCYATSEDGINWTRPTLNVTCTEKFPDNNILLDDQNGYVDSPSVLYDEFESDPQRRYKLAFYQHVGQDQGVRTKVSPDGIHWTDLGDFPVLPAQDALKLFQDKLTGKYYLNLKDRIRNRRSRLVSVSDDFETWSEPEASISPDLGDDDSTHFYDTVIFRSGDVNMGFLTIYDAATQICHTELVTGNTSMNFKRLPSRPTVLAPGALGDWDGGGVYTTSGQPIEQNDERVRYYYYGTRDRHELCLDGDNSEPATGFGIADYEEGRLCGQQFEGEGYLITVSMLCKGKELLIDANARDSLKVSIACCGYPSSYDGYAIEDCEELRGDSKCHLATWRGSSDICEFRGRYIKLIIGGRNSLVYGVKFR